MSRQPSQKKSSTHPDCSKHLRVFQANGYPTPEIDRTLRNQPSPPPPPPPLQTETQYQATPKFLYLPYIRGTRERIEQVCRPLGIRTIFKSRGLSVKPWCGRKSHNQHGRRKGWYTRYLVLNVTVYTSKKLEEHWRKDYVNTEEQSRGMTQRMALQYMHGRHSTK